MVRYSLKSDGRYLAALLLLTALIFGFGLGSFGLLDPDEPFYSLSAKEMLANHDLSTPRLFGQPQFEKPIFFYWTKTNSLFVDFNLSIKMQRTWFQKF